MKKQRLLTLWSALVLLSSCGTYTYAPMLTKVYVPDIKAPDSSRVTKNTIAKNGVLVVLQPFDINEYFENSNYYKAIKIEASSESSTHFPLVVNLFHNLSVFKVTIQNNGNADIYSGDLRSTEDANFVVRFDNSSPLTWRDWDNDLGNIKKLPCYSMAAQLINKKFYIGTNEETFPYWNIQNSIADVVYNIQHVSPTPLLNRMGGLVLRRGEKITGYIVFPQISKADATVLFVIDNQHYTFDVNLTPQWYKSTYDATKGKYTPYVPVSQEEYDVLLSGKKK